MKPWPSTNRSRRNSRPRRRTQKEPAGDPAADFTSPGPLAVRHDEHLLLSVHLGAVCVEQRGGAPAAAAVQQMTIPDALMATIVAQCRAIR